MYVHVSMFALVGGHSPGFHTEGGAGIFPPQPQFPPRNLEIEYGYYISYLRVNKRKYVSSKYCLEILSQIGSEAI